MVYYSIVYCIVLLRLYRSVLYHSIVYCTIEVVLSVLYHSILHYREHITCYIVLYSGGRPSTSSPRVGCSSSCPPGANRGHTIILQIVITGCD